MPGPSGAAGRKIKLQDVATVTRSIAELAQAFDFVTLVEEEYHDSLHLLYNGAILSVLVV